MDKRPYRMEFDMPEVEGAFPRLELTNRYVGVKDVDDMAAMLYARALYPDYTGGMMSSMTVRQGPIINLFLKEEELMLIEQEKGMEERALMTSDGILQKGLFEKLFPSEKGEGGIGLRVTGERARGVLEVKIPEKETYGLRLQYHKTNVVSIRAETGPLLVMFLMDGTLWLLDDASRVCIMSTERGFDVDTERFTYFDTPF